MDSSVNFGPVPPAHILPLWERARTTNLQNPLCTHPHRTGVLNSRRTAARLRACALARLRRETEAASFRLQGRVRVERIFPLCEQRIAL